MPNKEKHSARQISTTKDHQVVEQTLSVERSSILPPANEMAKYEEYCPGITKEMMSLFKKQSEHRMNLETIVVSSGAENSKRGQIFSFILSLIVIIGGFILIMMDKNILGVSAIIASLGTLTGVFIAGNKSKREERIKKSKENP